MFQLEEIFAYVRAGGFIMPALLMAGVTLWTLLGLRFFMLLRGSRGRGRNRRSGPAHWAKTGTLYGNILSRVVREVDLWHRWCTSNGVGSGARVAAGGGGGAGGGREPGGEGGGAGDGEQDSYYTSSNLRLQLEPILVEGAHEMSRYSRIIQSLCGVAPLLGLLGTVAGMVETFSSLTSMELFSQDGGIAGGISQALITTQVGLFVAIPGLIASRILDNKEDKMENDLLVFIEQQVSENGCVTRGEGVPTPEGGGFITGGAGCSAR